MVSMRIGGALGLLAGLALWPTACLAEGALAVGDTGSIANDGIAMGWTVGYRTQEEAQRLALEQCRNFRDASQGARDRCAIVEEFRSACLSISLDPEAGTPGVGWAVAPTEQEAIDTALERCRQTAGADRVQFCQTTMSRCDGNAR